MEAQAQLLTQKRPSSSPSFSATRSGFLQRKCTCGGTPGPDGKCAGCRRKQLTAQRFTIGQAQAEPFTAPPVVREVLSSPGQPLDLATRAFMEPRFGHDFGKVRVHSDAKAAESARAVSALAYTVGPHMVFDSGRYEPQTPRGRRLLAHELTHTVQQGASLSLPGELAVAPRHDPAEAEAGRVEERVKLDDALPAAETMLPVSVRRSPTVSRQDDGGTASGTRPAALSPDGEAMLGAGTPAPSLAARDPEEVRAVVDELVAEFAPYATKVTLTPDLSAAGSPMAPVAMSSGGGGHGSGAAGGVVGSMQLCFDFCTGEWSIVGWVWAGAGVYILGQWVGAYGFWEGDLAKGHLTDLHFDCGRCDPECEGDKEGGWGGGIAWFPVHVEPGKWARFSKAGIEIGALLTPHNFCSAAFEIIALVDIVGYLGPIGRAIQKFSEMANELAKRLGISGEVELKAGADVSSTLELCKSVSGGITLPSANVCGGAFVEGGFGLSRDKSKLPH